MKKTWSLMLSLCLLLCLLPPLSAPVRAAGDTAGLEWRMQQILNCFPDLSFSTTTGESLCTHGAEGGLYSDPCYYCREANIIQARYDRAVQQNDTATVALLQRLNESRGKKLPVMRTPGNEYQYNGKTVTDTAVEGCVTCRAFANLVWYLLYGFHHRVEGVTVTFSTDAKDASYGDFVAIPKNGYHYAIFLGWKDGTVGGTMLLYESNACAGVKINGGSGKGQIGKVSQITYMSEYPYKNGVKFGHPFNYDDMNAYYKSHMHLHDYRSDSRGICQCGDYSFANDSASLASYKKKAPTVYSVVKEGAPLRVGPYRDCNEKRTLSAGTELVIVGKLENAVGNTWYEVQGGGYIYSENIQYQRAGVTLEAPSVSYQSDANVVLKTTVSKLSGLVPEKYGCYLLDVTRHPLHGFNGSASWLSAVFRNDSFVERFEAADPNSGSLNRINATSYPLAVDLAREGGFEMAAGDEYIAQLFVQVGGQTYYSKMVQFIAGIISTDVLMIEPADSPGALGEAPDADAWLVADNTDPLGAQDVTFLYQVTDADRYRLVADYAGGGNYCTHSVGSGTVHALRFESLGDFICYVVAETPRGEVRTNSVTIHVHDPSGGSGTVFPEETHDQGPACVFAPADEPEYQEKEFFEARSACVVTRIDKRCGAHVSSIGIALFDENGVPLFQDYWNSDNIMDDWTSFFSWYTFNAEEEILQPNTLYYYSFHVTIDGTEYISDRRCFTTLKTLAERLKVVEPIAADFDSCREWSWVFRRYVPAGSTWGWFTTSGGTEPYYEGLPEATDPYGTFLGWFTAKEGGTQIIEGAPITAEEAITLYAHWQPYTLYIDLDAGGGTVSTQRAACQYGDVLALPAASREGYTFLGWFTDPVGGSLIQDDARFYAEYDALYAHWQRQIALPDLQSNPFTDVPEGSWYHSWVSQAYAAKLINGKDESHFAPDQNITMAEVLKLAACIRQLLTDGVVSLQNSVSGPWYLSYYDYLRENNLLNTAAIPYRDFSKIVTRGELVRIFYDVIPFENLDSINDIPANAIPDINILDISQSAYAFNVLTFYRAGILNGSDEYGTFHPDEPIQRSAVAAILVRIIDPSKRLGPPEKLGKG